MSYNIDSVRLDNEIEMFKSCFEGLDIGSNQL